ncbi:MAG: hypothetical protein OWS74_00685 [Firmicutes bacterium]|nr:hypothetical protein [Bacillota bacterium]
MADEPKKRSLMQWAKEQFQNEVAREIGIDLNPENSVPAEALDKAGSAKTVDHNVFNDED